MTARRIGSAMKDEARAKALSLKAARSDPRVVADAMYAMMTRDTRPEIGRIKARVLVLLTTGNLPEAALPEIEQLYRDQLAAIAQHELVLVPGSRHYLMFDAPETFFAQLDRFLAADAR